MKHLILVCCAILLLENGTFAQAAHPHKVVKEHLPSATQLANERTEKDAKLYSFTSEQKKKAYDINLDISRQLIAAKDQMNDKNLLRITEQKRFNSYKTFFTAEQMRKLVEERDKTMNELK